MACETIAQRKDFEPVPYFSFMCLSPLDMVHTCTPAQYSHALTICTCVASHLAQHKPLLYGNHGHKALHEQDRTTNQLCLLVQKQPSTVHTPVFLSTVEVVAACREHLYTPPFSDPTTNRLLSSRENDRQVPVVQQVGSKVHVHKSMVSLPQLFTHSLTLIPPISASPLARLILKLFGTLSVSNLKPFSRCSWFWSWRRSHTNTFPSLPRERRRYLCTLSSSWEIQQTLRRVQKRVHM